MKTLFKTPLVILGVVIFLQACQDESPYRFIRISGIESAYNISRSPYFGSYAGPDSIVRMAVTDGDLLMVTEDDFNNNVYLRYASSMGTEIHMYFDSLEPSAFYLNGDLHSIDMTRVSPATGLPGDGPGERLNTLKSLYLNFPLGEEDLALLDTVFPDDYCLNLIMEGEDSLGQLPRLLNRFRPEWLCMIDLTDPLANEEWLPGLTNVQLIATGLTGGKLSPHIGSLPSLEDLILFSEEKDISSPTPLSEAKKLKRLCIVDPHDLTLSFLADLPCLKELFLINADSLIQPEALSSLSGLQALGLSESPFYGSLPETGSLKWLSIPPNMDQSWFNECAALFPKLEILEARENGHIRNLSGLSAFPRLKGSIIDLPEASLSGLSGCSTLELLVVEQDIYNDSAAEISRLKEALPGIHIVPGGGFCLGSGWILWLIPFLLAGILLSFFRRKTHQEHEKA